MEREWYTVLVRSGLDVSTAELLLTKDQLAAILLLANELEDAGGGYTPSITIRNNKREEVTHP